ncbi:MAG: 5'/3'-nucleotidase SurE [Lachnospiraceae bacterium]|nr:5'/3'-nucleotidase SurE [Lachnospiraceae bacterium]
MGTRRILITNDDGIEASGIIRLAAAAVKFGEVWVVAPDSQRSAMSHSITLRDKIDVYPADFPVEGVKAYKSTGTPADCVRVGVLNIMKGDVDVVLSGINCGYNSATDMQYSATAGAAFEAAFQGKRAIAFSEGFNGITETTDRYLEEVIAELIDKPLEFGQIWNVNFPECRLEQCKGILRDRTLAHTSFYLDRYDETKLENGGFSYRVNGQYREPREEGSDMTALIDGYVSIGIAQNIS